MNYLVYQSYGSKDILNECCYSILSLLKHGINKNETRIVIYTDQPEYFSFLPAATLEFVQMSADIIADYKGVHAFVHRLKIKILQDAVTRFQGTILYVDSDIYFLKSIEPLFASISKTNLLMCNNEGRIHTGGNRIFEKFSAFIKKNTDYLKQHHIPIPYDITMWNAGVIGFLSTEKELLEKVLYTNDTIYNKFQSHVVEQLSFSYQLQKQGTLNAATDYLYHYWNFKEFRIVLAEFFKYHLNRGSVEQMIQDIDSIRPDVLIKPKLEYETLPFLKKNIRKLGGKKNRWKFPAYTIGQAATI
ncbi:hypothetical protein [Cytophaga hutchinsonii]|uniref:Uncharacterized protein n=1 Tax=Cytophaga hutchinsonii (strain ATCC 33406 / DSM 1761 / CIP 103989 / NBRC 15051 / NCIMB 9469 / D465) TaxID=269798 RepID=A0A6N4SNL8_CYTH3|nr:hypothetical protein [Cytophaga hutchinsonii]ABG57893.1 conserved hypothetical protein [Cytophaga hutchinsonii ATCC 33406]SFX08362.1 hypothetical protein SAMN04487930_101447 [Cytophaga hutchinsonii ATCC 33406]